RRSVAVKAWRAVFMLPVAVHVPGVCAGVVVPDIPVTKTGFPNESVTDLLHPAKARTRPTEQRTKPITARGLKKADREKELFFMPLPQVVRANPVVRCFPAERG